jgi:hypothetical protein
MSEEAYPQPDSNVVLNDLATVLNRRYKFLPLNVRYQAATKALEIVERDRVCFGCGSRRVVIRSRRAYCTEKACDRRLPGPPCGRCKRPAALHVCLSCSPDGLSAGQGCVNCRQTGWSQSPCSVADAANAALERSDPEGEQ